MIKVIDIREVDISGETQERDIDDAIFAKYAALMVDGVKFPPVDVVFDGNRYWLWDGFHRYHAAKKAGLKEIECSIENGSRRDAVYFSFHANCDHGFPRQEGVGKKIILRILADPEWSKMGPTEMAKYVGVTRQYVHRIIEEKKVASVNKVTPKTTISAQKATIPKIKLNNSEETEPPTEKEEKCFVADTVGNNVPDNLRDIFMRSNELRMLAHQITTVAAKIKEAKAKNDPIYYYINAQNVEVEAGNLKRSIKAGIPYAVCPNCGGSGGSCRTCAIGKDTIGKGWVNELRYKASAEELKKVKGENP